MHGRLRRVVRLVGRDGLATRRRAVRRARSGLGRRRLLRCPGIGGGGRRGISRRRCDGSRTVGRDRGRPGSQQHDAGAEHECAGAYDVSEPPPPRSARRSSSAPHGWVHRSPRMFENVRGPTATVRPERPHPPFPVSRPDGTPTPPEGDPPRPLGPATTFCELRRACTSTRGPPRGTRACAPIAAATRSRTCC